MEPKKESYFKKMKSLLCNEKSDEKRKASKKHKKIAPNTKKEIQMCDNKRATSRPIAIPIPVVIEKHERSPLAKPEMVGQSLPTLCEPTPSACEVRAELKCPVCTAYICQPILQCANGHLLCESCRKSVSACPTCEVPIETDIRNRSMEALASKVLFPCKFKSNGCDARVIFASRRDHEEWCAFKPYSCPCPPTFGCEWSGPPEQVVSHLRSHNIVRTHDDQQISKIHDRYLFKLSELNRFGFAVWPRIAFDHYFLIALLKQDSDESEGKYIAFVQLVGSPSDAEKFVYRFELVGQQSKLNWESKVRSIRLSIDNAINENHCLPFDSKTARMFSDTDHNMIFNVQISRI